MTTELTKRETQLLTLVHKGMTDPEIAEKIGLTYGTVRVYMHDLYTKMKFKNRTQAALWWERNKPAAKPKKPAAVQAA